MEDGKLPGSVKLNRPSSERKRVRPMTNDGSPRENSSGRPESRCWLVSRDSKGNIVGGVCPPPGPHAGGEPASATAPALSCIEVEAAGFNYKDALACTGHPGVARQLPLIPGLDVAGVLRTTADQLQFGTPVVVTGNGLGETRHGGFATKVWVEPEAIIERPATLSAEAAMAMGTAGLTALLATDRSEAIIDWHVRQNQPAAEMSKWLVTGASGGVGMLAVAAAAVAGHHVVACTRKKSVEAALLALGARAVITPAEAVAIGRKSLASGRYQVVIDTVGGDLLADLLRVVLPGGAVASIGNAGGSELHTTVFPFILRGVTLAGIDAAGLPSNADRRRLWPRLAELWPRVVGQVPVRRLSLDEIGGWAGDMLAGETSGRAVVIPALSTKTEA